MSHLPIDPDPTEFPQLSGAEQHGALQQRNEDRRRDDIRFDKKLLPFALTLVAIWMLLATHINMGVRISVIAMIVIAGVSKFLIGRKGR